ncbi:MAG: hypothetical protein LKM39_00925 [Chiayiivirga sp.]|jgi:hypothetical protein|nr:hypothetical protein [Chiayiivirga sp.]
MSNFTIGLKPETERTSRTATQETCADDSRACLSGIPKARRCERRRTNTYSINRLELDRAWRRLLGAERAETTADWLERDHYRALYRIARNARTEIDEILRRHCVGVLRSGRRVGSQALRARHFGGIHTSSFQRRLGPTLTWLFV